MKTLLLPLVALCALGFAKAHKNTGLNPIENLHQALFSNYDKEAPPKEHGNSTVEINVAITPIWMNLNSEHMLEVKLWNRYMWNDYRLTWDPKDFDNVNVIRVDASKLWIPDVVLYNRGKSSGQDRMPQKRNGAFCPALIFSDGSMLWVPETETTALCPDLNLDEPWAEQNCTLIFGSWTYDGNNLDVRFVENKAEMDLSNYSKASPIQINEQSAYREVKYYDGSKEPYVSLKTSIKFQRKYIPAADGVRVERNPELKSRLKYTSSADGERVSGSKEQKDEF